MLVFIKKYFTFQNNHLVAEVEGSVLNPGIEHDPELLTSKSLLAICFQDDILHGLFDPENGSDIFLRNVSRFSTDYIYISEKGTLHNHCYDDLCSYNL
jgi:hypothetical protein